VNALFDPNFQYLWALLLALLLFYPVRQLIWALYVRRAGQAGRMDKETSLRLKKRSTVTAILLCIIFSVLYTVHLFRI